MNKPENPREAPRRQDRGGVLHIVGLGPGDAALLPPMAAAALDRSKAIFGYGRYVDLLPESLKRDKIVTATGMTREMERCEAALDAAASGVECSLVCSGDPGIYAMAGLVYELAAKSGTGRGWENVALSVVPGIPALCAAAALLGAPLMHDFASVSLSDLLTPWEVIEKRLYHALAGDFVLALYNPRSRGRSGHLARALALARDERGGSALLGHVRNAFREGQCVRIATLADFDPEEADMLSILVLGNDSTRLLPAPGADAYSWAAGARLYTPRGYLEKYGNSFSDKGNAGT